MKNDIYNKLAKYILIGVFCVFMSSCGNKNATISQWTGKQITITDNLTPINTQCDTVFRTDKKAMTLIIVDSMQCAPCQLRLAAWKDFIQEYENDVDFRFVIYKINKLPLLAHCKSIDFKYPLWIDTDNIFSEANDFPSEFIYRCFLLDKNNRVLLVGNPLLSDELLELYKNTIEKVLNDEVAYF